MSNFCSLYWRFLQGFYCLDRRLQLHQQGKLFSLDIHHVTSHHAVSILVRADKLESWTQHVAVISAHATHKTISVSINHHLTSKVRSRFQESVRINIGHSFTNSLFHHCFSINAPSFVDLYVDQKPGIRNVNQARQPFDEFGLRGQEVLDDIFLLKQLCCCTQNFLIIALWKYNAFSFVTNLINHMAHDGIGQS